MAKNNVLPVSALKKKVDLSKYNFETTADIKPLDSVIGQNRAVRAINFGLAMNNASYNIFVTGMRGTGRTTIVKDLLNKAAANKKQPDDWFYVYNFENPDEPIALNLPSNRAKTLKKKFHRLISNLRNLLNTSFESENYMDKKNQILQQNQNKKREIFNKLENEAKKIDIEIKSSPTGFQTIPLIDEKPISEQQYQKLKPEERKHLDQNIKYIQKKIQEIMREVSYLDRSSEDDLENLNQNTARFIVEHQFEELLNEFKDFSHIQEYLKKVIEDIVQNVHSFLESNSQKEQVKLGSSVELKRIDKYKINHVVDNSQLKGAPVIYEINPTYNNLFGRIEKKSYMGFLYTDYTMIKAGSLLKANGGYLMLDIEQVLRQPFVYDALKRALRTRCLIIEDINELYGVMTSAGLKPHPIPLDIKVIIIGQGYIYHILHIYDEDFRKIFKVKADFDNEVKESKLNVYRYIQFITRVAKEENLLPFHKNAVQAVIEHASRLVDHQKKLSIQFAEIVRLIRESSYWAIFRKAKYVINKDVTRALEEEKYRRNLGEEKIQNAIQENVLKFDVTSKKIGQINGLAVYSLGDYTFGKPARITASTYIGSRGIINIEREAKLSGKIHDKGMLILAGYFASHFGDRIPLSFSASVTFEQSYGMIEGDSASCAELYAILSSLSEIPIYQGIAITGSVNQKGEVQAIGGVNEKIEGFFDVCKLHKLNGRQGVIIPRANVKNLMLRDDIIHSVGEKRFSIWSIDKIEEGIPILTGIAAGKKRKDGTFTKNSVFSTVYDHLVEFARNKKQFNDKIGKNSNKKRISGLSDEEDSDE
jgi:lon-related putative ATP-dependent protease